MGVLVHSPMDDDQDQAVSYKTEDEHEVVEDGQLRSQIIWILWVA